MLPIASIILLFILLVLFYGCHGEKIGKMVYRTELQLNSPVVILKTNSPMEVVHIDILTWSGLKAPAELPSADLHSLFFQIHPRWRFFIIIFYLKSSHRLKLAISSNSPYGNTYTTVSE